ncbi:MAG: hypothetical protein Q8O07_00445 [Chloroflexota bacterium]|nr:hypothetical protein [Chloroflexota bacterium]
MSALDRIAYYVDRRDEMPNQELARDLAAAQDLVGIREIAGHLRDKNKSVASDCIKMLYEIGYIKPELIQGYAGDFLDLLRARENRMVWGGMIALATVAGLQAPAIWPRVDDVIAAVDHGSLITVVWGVKALARVAAASGEYRQRIFPALLQILRASIPRDVPMHAESILPALDDTNRQQFLDVLASRQSELSPSQLSKVRRVVKKVQAANTQANARG